MVDSQADIYTISEPSERGYCVLWRSRYFGARAGGTRGRFLAEVAAGSREFCEAAKRLLEMP